MNQGAIALLVLAGFCCGIISTIAGAASLISYPILVFAGLPPIVANATNSIALSPSSFAAVFADRGRLPVLDRKLAAIITFMGLGTGLGATLLLVTPAGFFARLMPALLGFATAIYAVAPRLHAELVARGRGAGEGLSGGFLALGLYSGYFGAAAGVICLALLRIGGEADFVRANTMKNLIGCVMSLGTCAILALSALVSWPHALAMIAGNVAGGYCGARLARVVPAGALRRTIITLGAAATAWFAIAMWLRPLLG